MNMASGILTTLPCCHQRDRTAGQTRREVTDVRASSLLHKTDLGETHLVLQVNGEVGFKRLIPHFAGKAEKQMTDLWQEQIRGKPKPRRLPNES